MIKSFLIISLLGINYSLYPMLTLQRLPKCTKAVNAVAKRRLYNLLKPLVIVKQQERVVIERLGKYDRVLEPGLHTKWPLIENLRKTGWGQNKSALDLREHVHELPSQHVITKDNVVMTIDCIIYYKINSNECSKAIYEIENLPCALEKLSQTTLRNIIGSMHLDETLTSRDSINTILCENLGAATQKWGVTVTRVELQEITPPEGILNAMEKQMTAERERRALVTEAEGKREALIKQADGEREATIKKAQAKKEATILDAEARKSATILESEGAFEARTKNALAEVEIIEVLKKSIGDNTVEYIKAMEYIRTLPKITDGQNNKLIVVPHEMNSLAGLLASLKGIAKE